MKKNYIFILIILLSSPILLSAQYGYLDSSFVSNGKQNYPDFNPYLYFDKGLTRIDQNEQTFMLIGDIIKTDGDQMYLPIWKFVNDVKTAEVNGKLSSTRETFNIKCAAPFGGTSTDKFLIGGSRNQDAFIKKFDAEGETDINFGHFGEVIMDFGGNDVVRSIKRLSNGSYIVFIKTTGKIICRKLKSDGSWDLFFGTDGQLDVPVIGDSRLFAAVNDNDDIFFNTAINRIAKMSKTGIMDDAYNAVANLYLDLNISHLLALNDGSLIISGNELITQQSLIMYKLNAEGAQDNTFGSFGKTVVRYNGKFNSINKAELFGNRLYCVGDIDQDMFLAKFSANGIAVTTFGTDGKTIVEFGSSLSYGLDMKLSNSGKALLLGMRTDWLALARIIIAESPVITAQSSLADVCKGEPFQLFAQGGSTYEWTGNDGFTSTDKDPVVTIDPAYNGSTVTYRVKGFNDDGFSNESIVVVNIKPVISFEYEESLPCSGENSGHKVKILKNNFFDENTIYHYNSNAAQIIEEDNISVTFEFNALNSPFNVDVIDTLDRFCTTNLEVEFKTSEPILATLETTSIDSTCISVVTPLSETDPLTYLWSNGSTTKIASEIPAGPFTVMITNTVTGCTAVFEGECEEILSTNVNQLSAKNIFPNPATDLLNIVLEDKYERNNIKIFNANGIELINLNISDETANIDIKDLKPGIYFLKATSLKGKITTGKFIKI